MHIVIACCVSVLLLQTYTMLAVCLIMCTLTDDLLKMRQINFCIVYISEIIQCNRHTCPLPIHVMILVQAVRIVYCYSINPLTCTSHYSGFYVITVQTFARYLLYSISFAFRIHAIGSSDTSFVQLQ